MAGPLVIIVDLVATGGLLELYTYLVRAQGKMNGLIGLSEVLFMQDKQNYTDPLLKLRALCSIGSIRRWFCFQPIRGRAPSTMTPQPRHPAPQ